MNESELEDDARRWINEFITKLRSDLHSWDLEGLKRLQAVMRAELQKYDLRLLSPSDFESMLKLEQILSDSISVSAFLFSLIQLIYNSDFMSGNSTNNNEKL